ncbi:hypothetical protein FQN60_013987 [Etheostoma spectabile]|uniref:Uncharacterized protein n=1 Tax=Etheostoma spectabile TaxID=54343 RepID=A0A5J5CEG3_9PERO|nr:hypothetical protein FQN60_013987 [Etheostoma spectabile]
MIQFIITGRQNISKTISSFYSTLYKSQPPPTPLLWTLFLTT